MCILVSCLCLRESVSCAYLFLNFICVCQFERYCAMCILVSYLTVFERYCVTCTYTWFFSDCVREIYC